MKIFSLIIISLSCLQHAYAKEVASKVQGEIKDLYCGGFSDFDNQKTGTSQSDDPNYIKPISGRCVFFIETVKGVKYSIIQGSNPYTSHVPDGESHAVVVGRTASFANCRTPEKKLLERVSKSKMPKEAPFLYCYAGNTKFHIPNEEVLSPAKVSGVYSNTRGDTAEVTLEEMTPASLFKPASYEVNIQYVKSSGEEVYVSTSTDQLYWVKSSKRPYFTDSFADDCQSPDCFNTDGTLKFLKNKNGSYTLHLDFEHYNNSPSEYSDEYDFSESVFLKRKK